MTKLTIGLLALFLAACNNDTKVASVTATDSSQTSAVSLPYSVPITPDWEKGPSENVAIAMTALKAYEVGDSSQMGTLFADSIDFYYDGGALKSTRDVVWKSLMEHRSRYSNVAIIMHDYESVRSKARGEEWVSLWYTETVTDKAGKVDSTMCMDDLKLVNGKIRVIDTKIRRLAPKKI